MTMAVFRPTELEVIQEKILLDPPTSYPELSFLTKVEEEEETTLQVEEYTGPSVDDIRREVELYRSQWETEKEGLIASARSEAEGIVRKAEEAASREIQRGLDEAESLKQQGQEEAEKIVAQAQEEADRVAAEGHAIFEAGRREAEEQGRITGQESGFNEGKAEVERLVERTHIVLQRAQDKRGEILEETEQEIINLVLLIARKIVKVISENQRNVIISNVVQALRKVKARGDIIIRVNLADLNLATENTKNFINLVEGAKSLQIMEDPSVDSGGCVIETDFGEIDARIASQLAELETKILEISPIKSRAKPGAKPAELGELNGNFSYKSLNGKNP